MKFLLQSETKNNGRVFWRKGWIIGQKRRTWNDQDAERGTKEATRTLPPIGGAQKRRCSVSLAATRANAVVIRAASVSVRRFPRNIQSATFYSSSKHGRANIRLVLWISSKFLSHSCSVEGSKKSEVEGQERGCFAYERRKRWIVGSSKRLEAEDHGPEWFGFERKQ